jgi:hypothetical protein
MSRILRRPMFRGGKVIDSRGTGITSGLMDKPKRGLVDEPGGYAGEITTGGEIVQKNKPSFFGFRFDEPFFSIPTPENRIGAVKGFDFLSPKKQFPEEYTEDLLDKEQGKNIDELGFKKQPPIRYNKGEEKLMKEQDLAVGEGDLNLTEKDKKELNELYKTLDINETIEDYKGGVPDKKTKKLNINPNDPNNNQEQVTEVDAKTLMKENAELFKELLGGANEKKLKDARIQDASDYLLKFFEGSQREGATVGSSAADVAAFATSRPSKTERVKEAIDKTDQTAMALAINDYIAGKRSKEQIDLMKEKLGSNFAQQIALIDYKNKKRGFFDILTDNRGKMSESKAIIQSIKQAFGKNAQNVEEGANILFKENINEYFIFPDGSIKTVIENENGELIEDTLLGTGG